MNFLLPKHYAGMRALCYMSSRTEMRRW